jgi:hypothetical protein
MAQSSSTVEDLACQDSGVCVRGLSVSGETVFPFEQAMANLREGPASRWPDTIGEFATGVLPLVSPSFQLSPGDEIFTVGSCFARSIEAHLAQLGCRIPMLGFSLPPDEWHGLPDQALNKFTPPSFRQTLQWAAAITDRDGKVCWEDCEPIAFDCGGGQFLDLEIAAQTPVGQERFLERRQQIYDVTRTAFSASCVIMTPGLIEGWRDRTTGLFISGSVLRHKKGLGQGDRFELVVLDYDRCFDDLAASVDLIRARNPDSKMLVTTSPVPLGATFSGQDVRVANTYSKSVLRAACGALTKVRPAVDYFPSYESVTLTDPEQVWSRDRIHVTDAFVGRIVGRLAETYMTSIDPALVHGQQAAMALAAGDLETAEREARAALLIDPRHTDARLVLADVLLARKDMQGVQEAIAMLPSEILALPSTKLRLAKAVFVDDPELGVNIGLEACALPDAAREAFLWTDRALRATGAAPARREELLRAGASRFPQQPGLRTALAQVLEQSGRIADAITELRVASSLPVSKRADRLRVNDHLARLTAKAG